MNMYRAKNGVIRLSFTPAMRGGCIEEEKSLAVKWEPDDVTAAW